MKTSKLPLSAIVLAAGAVAAQAGFWQDAYTGLGYLATPSGSPVSTASNGERVNGARSGRLRIVPNGVVGGGYRLEFDRTFGVDSTGRPEVFRFGTAGDLTLSGALQATAGYDTMGKAKSGFADMAVNNLSYQLRSRIGVQDATLTGTLNVNNRIEINPLGFYNVSINVSNANSQLVLDGVVVRDKETTNFDVGPIVVNGNIFADGAAALLTSLGVDATTIEQLFPNSAIDQIDAAIRSAEQQASATSQNKSMAPLLLQSVLSGDGQAANTLLEGLVDGTVTGNGDNARSSVVAVPEPGTLLLVALGGSTLWYWRRRQT